MTVWDITHEWRDPSWYEYPEWHFEQEMTFSSEALARRYAAIKTAKIDTITPPVLVDKAEERYVVSETTVWDRLPSDMSAEEGEES